MGQEKVPVLVIIQGCHGKILYLSTTLCHYCIVLGTLFRKDSRNGGFPKLHLGLYPKKTLCTGNQGTVEGHVHVTDFYFLENIIFRWGIIQLYQILKIESSFCIIIGGHLQALPHFSQ